METGGRQMSKHPLVTETELRPEGLIVRLRGEVTSEAAQAFHALLSEPLPPTALLDFGEVDYINSAGIALLIGLLRHARSAGTTVRVIGLSDHYRRIFRMVGLTQYLEIF